MKEPHRYLTKRKCKVVAALILITKRKCKVVKRNNWKSQLLQQNWCNRKLHIPTCDGFDRNYRAGNIHKLAASYVLEPDMNQSISQTGIFYVLYNKDLYDEMTTIIHAEWLTLRILLQVLSWELWINPTLLFLESKGMHSVSYRSTISTTWWTQKNFLSVKHLEKEEIKRHKNTWYWSWSIRLEKQRGRQLRWE